MIAAPKRLVVIGASAGGIEALRTLVAALPVDFPAPVCVVLHMSPQSPGLVDEILTRVGGLKATNAANGDRLQPGRIYVAPPDFHLLVEPGRVRISKGPRENRFRPAIDPLFRSAAQVYGPATIGVILTGSLDDGSAGLWAIKHLGGTAIVQDPADALFPGMPANAIAHVEVDYVVPLDRIAPLLVELTAPAVEPPRKLAAPDHLDVEVKIAMEENPIDAGLERIAEPSRFACPECHGVLPQLKEGGRIRFRCHTGHAYSIGSLLAGINQGIEESLWSAIRALEEGQLLMCRMADHLKTSHDTADADRLTAEAGEVGRQSDVIRKLVTPRSPLSLSSK